MKYVVISCSLDPESRSRSLAQIALSHLEAADADTRLIDIRETPIPLFDNDEIFSDQNFLALFEAIDSADGIVLAAPVYNWSLGSVVKQIIEATGATGERDRKAAWFDKVVTFVCAGGLPHSYTAYTAMAMPLMLDFKCIINPYAVYATERDWQGPNTLSQPLAERMAKTMQVKTEITNGLANRSYTSDWEV